MGWLCEEDGQIHQGTNTSNICYIFYDVSFITKLDQSNSIHANLIQFNLRQLIQIQSNLILGVWCLVQSNLI